METQEPIQWFDTHCHIDKLKLTPEAVLERAQAVGVQKMITIGTEPEDLPVVLALSERFPEQVYCTLGIHPHEGVRWSQESADFILANASRPNVVALGEMGLDYYYNHSEKQAQLDSFAAQLDLAVQLQLPVEIHTRDAEADTIDILNQYRGRVKGLIHCFTGTSWLAEKALDLGFNISISGVATFKSAQDLRETIKKIPLDRIHIETDSPFLAPIPHRGKENEPAFVVHTAQVVADLKSVSLQQLSQQLRKNTLSLFPKIRWA